MSVGYRVCPCGSAFYPRRAHHRLCWSCWSSEQSRTTAPDLIGVLRGAVELCRPDRHPVERQDQATKITQELLELLEGGRR